MADTACQGNRSACACQTSWPTARQKGPELFGKLGYRADPHKDRWRIDHEMGWWGAAYFGKVDDP